MELTLLLLGIAIGAAIVTIYAYLYIKREERLNIILPKTHRVVKYVLKDHFVGIGEGGQPFVYCPAAGNVSFNRNDVKHRYCPYEHIHFDTKGAVDTP